MSQFTRGLLTVAVLFGGVGGLITASILKYLDNVVKEYTGNCANILVAVIASLLFPDKFQFTKYMVMSMMTLLTGIMCYERFKPAPPPSGGGGGGGEGKLLLPKSIK